MGSAVWLLLLSLFANLQMKERKEENTEINAPRK